MEKKIVVCSRCLKMIEIGDLIGKGFGFLDRKVRCAKCGFIGLPVELHEEE